MMVELVLLVQVEHTSACQPCQDILVKPLKKLFFFFFSAGLSFVLSDHIFRLFTYKCKTKKLNLNRKNCISLTQNVFMKKC